LWERVRVRGTLRLSSPLWERKKVRGTLRLSSTLVGEDQGEGNIETFLSPCGRGKR